jgi:hypothetical protein
MIGTHLAWVSSNLCETGSHQGSTVRRGSHRHCLGKKDTQLHFLFLRSIILLNPSKGEVETVGRFVQSKTTLGQEPSAFVISHVVVEGNVLPTRLGVNCNMVLQ